jgi:hypothetical protein
LAGFSGGDKEYGLSCLRECHEANSVRSDLATIVLSANHLFLNTSFFPQIQKHSISVKIEKKKKFKIHKNCYLNKQKEAEKLVCFSLEKYPDSSIFNSFRALIYMGKKE